LNTSPLLSLAAGLSLACIVTAHAAAPTEAAPWGAPPWVGQALVLDHPDSIDEFGAAVALEGTTLMVGAPLYPQDQGGNGGQGAVFVYTYADGQWTLAQTLQASDATPGAAFGNAIVIRGGVAVIAAPTESVGLVTLEGAVYTFELVGGEWSETQKLVKANGTPNDNYFGESIAFDGSTIVIGESAAGTSTGEPPGGGAYVFTRVGDQWTQTAVLAETDGDQMDAFGRSVAVSGDSILVASPEARWDENGPGPGSVHFFARAGDTWTETQLIEANTPVAGEYFGETVALDGPLAIFGAPGATIDGTMFAGQVYVFTLDGAQWTQREIIAAEDVEELAAFGRAIAIKGTKIAVGAPGVTALDVPFAGAAYLYDIAGTAVMEKRFISDAPLVGDYFGYAVDLQPGGWQVASGVPHAIDDGSGNPGSAYVFTNDDVVFASGFDGS
jgi:hypothetical protein